MDMELTTGTYTHTKGEEGLDFWIKQGVPENEARSFVGSHWTMKVGFQDQKLWCKLECEEFPMLNLFMSNLEEGKEYCIPDKGFGKSSIVFNSIPEKPNMVHTVEKTERYGTYEVVETYCEEGIKMEYISKDKGTSYVENWCRVVKDSGSFRFKRGENLDMVKDLFPELPAIDEGYKIKWSVDGDTMNEVATFGDGTSFTTTWKLDVETPFMGCNFLMTKIPRGYKTVCRNKEGKIHEYTTKITENGALQHMLDHETGKEGFIEFARFVDFSGEFKPITNVGGANIAMAMGWPGDIYQKIMSNSSTKMMIKEVGGHLVFDFKSDAMPKETSQGETAFKFGEEFEWKNPFDPTEKLTMVATAKDNEIIIAGKGKMSISAKYIFTESFVVREFNICGTGMTEKVIFLRC